MNFRIIKNHKKDCYYIKYKWKNKYFYIRGDGSHFNKKNDYILSIWKYALYLFIISIPVISILLGILTQSTLFAIVLMISPISSIIMFRFLKKTKFGTLNSAKEWINKYNKYVEKTSKKDEIISFYINGEYIDGKKLERWKKLERIVNDKNI
jgi:hypothetical protein